jgi:hypothetical protein
VFPDLYFRISTVIFTCYWLFQTGGPFKLKFSLFSTVYCSNRVYIRSVTTIDEIITGIVKSYAPMDFPGVTRMFLSSVFNNLRVKCTFENISGSGNRNSYTQNVIMGCLGTEWCERWAWSLSYL